mgnify:CR=1 FL=1
METATFGVRLRVAMDLHGWNQPGLAGELGVSTQGVNQCVCGYTEPKASAIAGILRAMPAVDARWLICGVTG